ncbi:hypothetical protein LP52_21790 [Streptomonospora alba]|uniref:Uncharacterized protein n=1 Tax=Streptomonospora alba TaxID=183763 RepID=A0A0C2JD92_9ACTN|nr:hypothetical protein LP52_21790 [Streptomonospora alba]
MQASGGEVVHRSGFDTADEQREPSRFHQPLQVTSVDVGFSGVPEVDPLALSRAGREELTSTRIHSSQE